MNADEAKTYWGSIHEENTARDVSWYQDSPRLSLAMLRDLSVTSEDRILDVGCGQRGVAGALVDAGFARVSALDVSKEALLRAREEIGADRAGRVDWIEADVRELAAAQPFDVWHDRALLHFFLDPAEQRAYAASLRRNLAPRGRVVLATFALDGPQTCSGLPVRRHDAASLHALLGPEFALVASEREAHVTPWGATQPFQWAAFRRA